jgi:inhibitor of cysteine peptidase
MVLVAILLPLHPGKERLMPPVLLASLLAVVVAGCATAPRSPTTDAPVKAVAGQIFIVRLAANASTGYSWAWDEGAAAGVLVQVGEPTMAGVDPQRVGGGGIQTWRFRAATGGKGELRLDYRRQWEKDTPPVQTVRWQIQVQ